MSDKLTQAVLGFRQWSIGNEGLHPSYYGKAWKPGINAAVCHGDTGNWWCDTCDEDSDFCKCEPEAPHQAPAADCGCGLYAWHTLDMLREKQTGKSDTIFGAVAGWGKVYAHNTGWRAENARVLALSCESKHDLRQKIAQIVADMYGVPLVPFDMLQLEGARHAGAVPNELIPDPPPEKKKRGGGATFAVFDQVLKDVWTNDKLYWSASVVPLKKSSVVQTYNVGDILAELKKPWND